MASVLHDYKVKRTFFDLFVRVLAIIHCIIHFALGFLWSFSLSVLQSVQFIKHSKNAAVLKFAYVAYLDCRSNRNNIKQKSIMAIH